MLKKHKLNDYGPVTRSARGTQVGSTDTQNGRPVIRTVEVMPIRPTIKAAKLSDVGSLAGKLGKEMPEPKSWATERWITKRGHAVSYAGLFVFTFLVYFRPYELFPSLAWLSKSAFVVALITLAAFIPIQLGLENRVTAKPREVKIVVALLITGALSIPFALDPGRAFESFIEYFKVIAIFIVMVNVVRTEKRLRGLVLLVLFVSCVLAFSALYDYVRGNLALEGRRIAGLMGGLFSNPNDLALHLVTIIPISFALMVASRGIFNKILYLGCSVLLVGGMVATFSRGGFLGFVCVTGFLVWKFAGRNRVIFGAVALVAILTTIAVAPSAYRSRIATTDDASAVARTDDLKRSILVAARHPIFGVGMDNYIIYSNLNKATHNAYTQVAAEMGLLAFLLYLAFLITPFRHLHRIEQASAKVKPRMYYLAAGLQASLVGFMVVSFFASVAYQWYAYYLVAYAVSLQRLATTESASTLKPVSISN